MGECLRIFFYFVSTAGPTVKANAEICCRSRNFFDISHRNNNSCAKKTQHVHALNVSCYTGVLLCYIGAVIPSQYLPSTTIPTGRDPKDSSRGTACACWRLFFLGALVVSPLVSAEMMRSMTEGQRDAGVLTGHGADSLKLLTWSLISLGRKICSAPARKSFKIFR